MKKKILFILLIGVVSLISIQCSKEKKENKQAEAQKSDNVEIVNDSKEKKKEAKNQKNYEVKTKFTYSDDGGKTYGDNKIEFKVGETVYMRLSIEVKEKKEEVGIIAYIGGGAASGAAAGAAGGAAIGASVGPAAGATVGGTVAAAATAGPGAVPGAAAGAAAGAAVGAPTGAVIGGAIGGLAGGVAGGVAYFVKKTDLDFVSCELIIPNITSVDARYINGTKITSLKDEISGVTTYPFQIPISLEEKEVKKQESLIFQFIPNKESEISVDLIFDDNIAEQYDRVNTIIFVK